MKLVGEALDQVRRSEQKIQPILQNSRILWLKNRVNLSQNEETRFAPLSEMNLKTARAYRMKEGIKKFGIAQTLKRQIFYSMIGISGQLTAVLNHL